MYKQTDNEGVKYMELYRGKLVKRFADMPECRTNLVKQGIIKAGFVLKLGYKMIEHMHTDMQQHTNGKTVFLTREESENACAKRSSQNDKS